jgi:hypothetical protein
MVEGQVKTCMKNDGRITFLRMLTFMLVHTKESDGRFLNSVAVTTLQLH